MSGEAGFVFLSYGHDGFASRAERLKADLTQQGYQVWYDKERLKPGVDWEQYIDDGISRAEAAGDKGKFVLLMTPHSVRRDQGGKQSGGFCLNELTRALGRQLFIVPVMMDWCEPPLSICRIQWLDMRECFPPEERSAAYSKALEQLVQALKTKALDFDGISTKLYTTLKPLDYGELLSRYLARFTGRQWIFSQLDAWVDSENGPRISWLSGRPGVGKSALAVWYTQNREAVGAFHFCRASQSETTDVRRAVQSIAFQLSSQFPAYRDALNLVDFGELAKADAATLFANLLIQKLPQQNPRPGQPTVIVIDGLDEATENGKNALADLIAADFKKTPVWLRLLVTSRPEANIKATLQGLTPKELSADAKENLGDAAVFVRTEFGRFAKSGAISDKTVDEVLKRSQGLFLYLERVREELEQGRLSLDNVEAFPQGLGEVYDQYFKRQFPTKGEYELVLPALETIMAAREPLTSQFLRKLLSWSEYQIRDTRAALGSMFVDMAGRFQPFHASVVEWLTNEEKADRFFVSRAEGSRRLAGARWEDFVAADGTPDSYLAKFLPAHLTEMNRQSELDSLLLNYSWIQAKLRLTGVFALTADYRRLPSLMNGPVQVTGEALQLSAGALVGNPAELPSQLHGRLLEFEQPELRSLLKQAAAGKNGLWLKPRAADLTPPGTELIATLTQSGPGISSAVLDPDGTKVIFFNGDELRLWKPLTAEAPITLHHAAGAAMVAISADGKYLAISEPGGTVHLGLLNNDQFELKRTFTGALDTMAAMEFSNNGTGLVLISKEGAVQVIDIAVGGENVVRQTAITIPGLGGAFVSVGLAGEAGLLMYAESSFPTAIQFRDIKTGEPKANLSIKARSDQASSTFAISRLAATPQANVMVLGGTDIQIWRRGTAGLEFVRTISGHEFLVNALAISADGSKVVSATLDSMHLWDLKRPGQALGRTGRASVWPGDIDLDVDRSRVWVTFSDGKSGVYDLQTGTQISKESAPIRETSKTSDGRGEIVSSEGKLKFRDVRSGKVLRTFPVKFNDANGSAVLYPDDSSVVIGSEYMIGVWDLMSGVMVRKLEGDFAYGPAAAVANTRNGLRIAGAMKDYSVGIWDGTNASPMMTLKGHVYSVWSIAFLTGGERLMTSSGDGTIVLWNVLTGSREATFTADTGIVCSACTPDNSLIVAGDLAGQLHFLEIVDSVLIG